jgi:hypothetical protein
MARSILAVVLSLILMACGVLALTMALWFTLGVDGVLKPGTFDAKPILDAWSVVVSIAGALIAGWLCAAISRSHAAVIALAVLCLLMAVGNAVGQHAKPAPGPRDAGIPILQAMTLRKEPAWFTFLMPIAGGASILLAGRARLGRHAPASGPTPPG